MWCEWLDRQGVDPVQFAMECVTFSDCGGLLHRPAAPIAENILDSCMSIGYADIALLLVANCTNFNCQKKPRRHQIIPDGQTLMTYSKYVHHSHAIDPLCYTPSYFISCTVCNRMFVCAQQDILKKLLHGLCEHAL